MLPLEKQKSSLTQIGQDDIIKLNKIIAEIKSNPDSINFYEPVDTKIFKDYLKAINERPMDIKTIEKKLSQRKYHFIQDVFDDFQLIWDNCRIYNKEGFEIYNQAERMDKFCLKCFEKFYHVQKYAAKNFCKQYDDNVYDEEAFNDPNYYIDNVDLVEPYHRYLKEKIFLLRTVKNLNKEKMKKLLNDCKNAKRFVTIGENGNYILQIHLMELPDIQSITKEILAL